MNAKPEATLNKDSAMNKIKNGQDTANIYWLREEK